MLTDFVFVPRQNSRNKYMDWEVCCQGLEYCMVTNTERSGPSQYVVW